LFILPAWTRSLIFPAVETIPRIFRIMDIPGVTARIVACQPEKRKVGSSTLPLTTAHWFS
jgi:hypothetical protein